MQTYHCRMFGSLYNAYITCTCSIMHNTPAPRDTSMVLQTGQEINELDSSGFCTTQPTVFAGNIGGSKFIVQVTPDCVLLLEHSELVQKLAVDLGCPIQSACVADPHLALLGTNGECAVLSLQEGGVLRVVKQHVGEMPGRAKSAMVAISLYRDTSGLLTTVNRLTRGKERLTHRQASAARLQELDEEDEDVVDMMRLLPKREMRLLLPSLLKYCETLTKMITFNTASLRGCR